MILKFFPPSPQVPQAETDEAFTAAGIDNPKPKENTPSHMQDFMARSYASWLAWWKNTINSDDYMKYLSAQVKLFLRVCRFREASFLRLLSNVWFEVTEA